jgi:hypothetical protein
MRPGTGGLTRLFGTAVWRVTLSRLDLASFRIWTLCWTGARRVVIAVQHGAEILSTETAVFLYDLSVSVNRISSRRHQASLGDVTSWYGDACNIIPLCVTNSCNPMRTIPKRQRLSVCLHYYPKGTILRDVKWSDIVISKLSSAEPSLSQRNG